MGRSPSLLRAGRRITSSWEPIDADEMEELVENAWAMRFPPSVANQYLAARRTS